MLLGIVPLVMVVVVVVRVTERQRKGVNMFFAISHTLSSAGNVVTNEAGNGYEARVLQM